MAPTPSEQAQGIIDTFRRFDTEGKGLLERQALLAILVQSAPEIKDHAETLITSSGTSKEGKVRYEHFFQWLWDLPVPSAGLKAHASLGVIRLDYDYPPSPGDIDCAESFGYDVFYKVVPGLTFTMCQSGEMTPAVKAAFLEAITYLDSRGVSAITGDCGFMMYFQALARQNTKKPVFMSALAQLPAVTCAYAQNELIAIFTANGESLKPMRNLIKDECGVDPDENRFVIVGCEDVPGFEAVALGEKVNVKAVTPGMVAKAQQVIKDHPAIRAILMECTELPPYSDALRYATGLPVYDAISGCDFCIAGLLDNKRFGLNDWHSEWDGEQERYVFGKHLSAAEKQKLVNKVADTAAPPPVSSGAAAATETLDLAPVAQMDHPSLGVVRLDYNYPPAPGDIDCPQTFAYDTFYRAVPGLTFEMCQSGKMSDEVRQRFLEAIAWLNSKGVAAITGDCGFMMYFQALARQNTKKPVFMSALAQLPAVTCAYARDELIAIFTANGESLKPMRDLIKDECGVDPDDSRFVIVGCEDVRGFEAVALGQKVDVQAVTPGMVAKAQQVIAKHPAIRAILMECTELPPYSDAVRAATGLPVYDAITACDFCVSGRLDNKRFGMNDWQRQWDGKQDKYVLGQNLSGTQKAALVTG